MSLHPNGINLLKALRSIKKRIKKKTETIRGSLEKIRVVFLYSFLYHEKWTVYVCTCTPIWVVDQVCACTCVWNVAPVCTCTCECEKWTVCMHVQMGMWEGDCAHARIPYGWDVDVHLHTHVWDTDCVCTCPPCMRFIPPWDHVCALTPNVCMHAYTCIRARHELCVNAHARERHGPYVHVHTCVRHRLCECALMWQTWPMCVQTHVWEVDHVCACAHVCEKWALCMHMCLRVRSGPCAHEHVCVSHNWGL